LFCYSFLLQTKDGGLLTQEHPRTTTTATTSTPSCSMFVSFSFCTPYSEYMFDTHGGATAGWPGLESWMKQTWFRFDARLRMARIFCPNPAQQATKPATMAAAAVINVPNNLPERDDESPDFERLLRQIDNDDPDFNGMVRFGQYGMGVALSDDGAQRLGQSLLRATARGRQFVAIHICTYYMTEYAGRYSALLDFFATGQYHVVVSVQGEAWPTPPPEMAAAMERIAIAMMANQQRNRPLLSSSGVSLRMQTLHLALQYPWVHLIRCRMESPFLVLPNDSTDHDNHPTAAAAAALQNRPERGSCLHLFCHNNWFEILWAAATLKTNMTRLRLSFEAAIVG
jgi:hypothetical protein